MKRIIVLLVIVLIIVSVIFLLKNSKTEPVAKVDGKKIVTVFKIPHKEKPECYPIEVIDYKETITSKEELMIFARTVWSKDVSPELGKKPVAVPIEIYKGNPGTGEKVLVSRSTSSSKDGHIVIILKNPDENYFINIDIKNAENCPERFKAPVE